MRMCNQIGHALLAAEYVAANCTNIDGMVAVRERTLRKEATVLRRWFGRGPAGPGAGDAADAGYRGFCPLTRRQRWKKTTAPSTSDSPKPACSPARANRCTIVRSGAMRWGSSTM